MEAKAIVYTSNTGYTAQYAALLAKKTGLHAYAMNEALEKVPEGSAVIYMGWIMAGKIQGFITAAKHYRVTAVCGVGMGATGSQTQDLRRANALPSSMPVFTLQGGFDMARLRGVYKLMMTVMVKTAGKGLAEKQDRTPDEDAMLELMLHGGSRVSEENLAAVWEWCQQAR